MVMAVLKFVEERERRWKEEEEEERFAWQLASQAITAPLPSQASVRFGKRKRHTHTLPLTFKREGEGGRKMEEGGGESPPRGFGLCVRVCTTCVRRVCVPSLSFLCTTTTMGLWPKLPPFVHSPPGPFPPLSCFWSCCRGSPSSSSSSPEMGVEEMLSAKRASGEGGRESPSRRPMRSPQQS